MKKFFNFLRNLFRNLKSLAQKFVSPSVEIVENIKRLVDSPLTDILTGLIPGTLDDHIKNKLRQKLPEVLKILRISDECLKLQAADEIILCAIRNLKSYTPDGRAAAYHSIAAMLAHYASDKKITWSEAVHLSELIFKEKKQPL